MLKVINFYDHSEEMFFIEEGISLKEALGKDFKKFAKTYLEGVDKAFYELPVEKEYKNIFSFYRGFEDIKLEDLIDEFSLKEDDPLVKNYKDRYFNIRAITIWEEDLGFGCFVLDPELTIYDGVKKIMAVGKECFTYAFTFNGDYRVIVLIKF